MPKAAGIRLEEGAKLPKQSHVVPTCCLIGRRWTNCSGGYRSRSFLGVVIWKTGASPTHTRPDHARSRAGRRRAVFNSS